MGVFRGALNTIVMDGVTREIKIRFIFRTKYINLIFKPPSLTPNSKLKIPTQTLNSKLQTLNSPTPLQIPKTRHPRKSWYR